MSALRQDLQKSQVCIILQASPESHTSDEVFAKESPVYPAEEKDDTLAEGPRANPADAALSRMAAADRQSFCVLGNSSDVRKGRVADQ